jgi:hypothetical protein
MCAAKRHVCVTPISDIESEIPQKAMSALPPKADMCGAKADVRYGPIADMMYLGIRRPEMHPAYLIQDPLCASRRGNVSSLLV